MVNSCNQLDSVFGIAEPQTHLYLPHRLVVDITIDGPTTTTTPDSLSRAIAI